MIAVATDFGQPWSEAKAMGEIERKSFLYASYIRRGWTVDWSTGRLTEPKTK